MKTKYLILSIVGIIIMGLWLGGAGVLNTGLHPIGIIIFPLYVINSIITLELESDSKVIDMDEAIAENGAYWELINERTNNRATARDLDWAMNQTNNDFDKSMELINNYYDQFK